MIPALVLIAGKGDYPLELARAARAQGLDRLAVIAFCGETRREIADLADDIRWLRVGQLTRFREALSAFAIPHAVMAGQITPSNLFLARFDKPMRELLASLPRRNADTIFGAVAKVIAAQGVELLPAHRFMESRLAPVGVLTRRAPTDSEWADIRQGRELARVCARFQVGQSVAMKQGTVIAVEGFEGTDAMIRRARRVGGAGVVVVKAAQEGHDMRWDIPVAGPRTLRSLRKARAAGLAVEAGKVILLEREVLIAAADAAGMFLVGMETA